MKAEKNDGKKDGDPIMKITNEQLKQIIKEELQAVMDEGIYDAPSSDKEAEQNLRERFLNYLDSNNINNPDGVREWMSDSVEGGGLWNDWMTTYNAFKTSATGTMGLDSSQLPEIAAAAIAPIMQNILSQTNAPVNFESAKKWVMQKHQH